MFVLTESINRAKLSSIRSTTSIDIHERPPASICTRTGIPFDGFRFNTSTDLVLLLVFTRYFHWNYLSLSETSEALWGLIHPRTTKNDWIRHVTIRCRKRNHVIYGLLTWRGHLHKMIKFNVYVYISHCNRSCEFPILLFPDRSSPARLTRYWITLDHHHHHHR